MNSYHVIQDTFSAEFFKKVFEKVSCICHVLYNEESHVIDQRIKEYYYILFAQIINGIHD